MENSPYKINKSYHFSFSFLREKITISPLADRNEKLGEIYDYLDQLKDALSDIVYDMDEEDEDEAETVDTLTNALEQIDDALDAIADVIE